MAYCIPFHTTMYHVAAFNILLYQINNHHCHHSDKSSSQQCLKSHQPHTLEYFQIIL